MCKTNKAVAEQQRGDCLKNQKKINETEIKI